ncbi:50S ribosomal protein L10 [Porphyromonadaceae bacterium COT-184 OH4590]|nr:50S ribosomal protein L10 [Porphyromonadaceae bacterium COT-184 OH4590]MDO4725903.1 50S ribosomal protein L10 [Porphyromonadaceae bacterium]
MRKEDKTLMIAKIEETLKSYSSYYLTDAQGLNAEQVSNLRRKCSKQDIKMFVVKNTLLRKAFENLGIDASQFGDALKLNTALFLSNTGNAPAKLIKDFVGNGKVVQKPVLKAAYVEECFYVGANQLDTLIDIKSKNELIGDIIGLLQSPAKNVVSALQSGGNKLSGIVKTLSERE